MWKLETLGPSGGRPFVFLHGTPLDRRTWKWLIERAPADARCILIDAPDHGEAPDDTGNDPQLFVRTLMECLDALPHPRVTLVGNSIGATAVAHACSRAPERIERAVMISGFVELSEPERQARAELADQIESGALPIDALVQAFAPQLVGGGRTDGFAEGEIEALLTVPPERVVRSLRRVAVAVPGPGAFNTPAVVMHGLRDETIPFRHGEELAAMGSKAELVPLETSAHCPQISHPDFVAQAVFA